VLVSMYTHVPLLEQLPLHVFIDGVQVSVAVGQRGACLREGASLGSTRTAVRKPYPTHRHAWVIAVTILTDISTADATPTRSSRGGTLHAMH